MNMPNVVVFKLCNILAFRGLTEEIILKHKIDSQWGAKRDKKFCPQY